MTAEGTGFSHGAFASNSNLQLPGFGNRSSRRGNIPSLNTLALQQGEHGITSPGTAYDMNFTPLLPSQLLLGSPFQPASPGPFGSPQFPTFPIPQTHLLPNQQPLHSSNYGQLLMQHQQQSSHNQVQTEQTGAGSPHQQAQQHSLSQSMSPHVFQASLGQSAFPMQPLLAPQSPTSGFPALLPAAGAYGAANFGSPQMMGGSSRTVYLGNIPPDTPVEEILNHVRSGAIESVRVLADKHCAFIAFLDASSATHFHSDAILKRLSIHGQEIKIGWGKPSQVSPSVLAAVQQSSASRNVYLGNVPEAITEERLREELGKYGAIDTVKIVREKSIAFVHFLAVSSAIKAVANLPQEAQWQHPRRVNYGKDRCAYISKTQQQNAAQFLGIPASHSHMLSGVDRDMISSALAQQSATAAAVATTAGGMNNMGNRTIYLGNIHPETTTEEICNVIRGGLLHHIRYIADKHICFATFIDPTAAAGFFAQSVMHGLMIHNRRLKLGWGKHSGALPPAIALAVAGGASRNVYIGNLDESWNEDQLRADFSEFGEIELVNTLREKSCAFVNFTNIQNAIKAIEAMRSQESYKRFKVNFGKDRCGNPPRQPNISHHHHHHHQQHSRTAQMIENLDGSHNADVSFAKDQHAASQPGSSGASVSPANVNGVSMTDGFEHDASISPSVGMDIPALGPNASLLSYLSQINQVQQDPQHQAATSIGQSSQGFSQPIQASVQLKGHQHSVSHSQPLRQQVTNQAHHNHRQSYDALASSFLQQPNHQRPMTDRMHSEPQTTMGPVNDLMNGLSLGGGHQRGSIGGVNGFGAGQNLTNGHGSSNGFASTSRASLAVPRLSAHTRAASLPYVSQLPHSGASRPSANGFGGLTSGFGGLSSFTNGNFDPLSSLQERSLHGWPEEEVRGS